MRSPPADIGEALIKSLVETFYARVREDDLIGPVFTERVKDWTAHMARMCLFWSSVVMGSRRYQGQPMPLHLPLPVDSKHFDRWLELFRDTARSLCSPPAAELFISRAENIARSLEMGIAVSKGIMLGIDERYVRRRL